MSNILEDSLAGLDMYLGDLRRNWGWFLALGIILLVLGIIGLGMVGTMTLATTFYIGILFIIAAIAQVVYAFKARDWKGVTLSIIVGLLYGYTGYTLLTEPLVGSAALTIVLALTLLVAGVFRIITAFKIRPLSIWVWILISGILSIILAIMIFSHFPASTVYTLGIFLSIELISMGVTNILLAFTIKNSIPKRA